MEFQVAQEFADAAVFAYTGRHLNDVEIAVLQGAWQGQTYNQIVIAIDYSPAYITRSVGPALWQLLKGNLSAKRTLGRLCSAMVSSARTSVG